ncbi:MAG TPA: hypothetical protein PLZ15_12350 [Melioribacteraceae bacterium]|nr:hypothetical protein [Melioribacteraceae bacterium]
MKRIKILSLFAIIAVTLGGCNQPDNVEPKMQDNIEAPQFILIDNSDILNGIEDATLDSDMKFNSSLFNFGFMNMGGNLTPGNPVLRGNPWLEKFDFTKQLGMIFRKLNLDETQRAAVKELIKGYHESLKPLLIEFRAANEAIVKEANEKRKEIMTNLRNGEITRQEASAQLFRLNRATRDKIKDNPESLRIADEICRLNSKLLEDIESLLNNEQKVKWEQMVQRLKKDC